MGPVYYDLNLDYCPAASGGVWWNTTFTTTETRKKEKEIKMSFTLKVKDGSYGRNPETGQYGIIDLVETYDDTVDALAAFLGSVQEELAAARDGDDPTKVTLTFSPKKAKKGKK